MTRRASNEVEMSSSSRADRLDDDHSTPVGATSTNGNDSINGVTTGGVVESGIANEEQKSNGALSSGATSTGNGKKQ